jgi:hypothetical protein
MSPDLPKLLRWMRDSEVAAPAESADRLREHLDSPDAVVALTALIQSLRRRKKRPPRPAKTTYYEPFRDDVLASNHDGATDHVYMLTAQDWARLEAEHPSFPDEATSDLIEILGHGPDEGLRILASLLRASDPRRARDAADAIATMAETHADGMAISSSEAALLERLLPTISLPFASVLQRAVPDVALTDDETIASS